MESPGWEIGGKLPWLSGARWFSAKGGDGRIVLYDAARIPERSGSGGSVPQPTWIGLIEWSPKDGTSDDVARVARRPPEEPVRYVVPLTAADGGFVDASRSNAFVAWLLRAVLAEESLPANGGRFEGHAVGRRKPPTSATSLSIADVGGDASNTSLAVSWGSGQSVIVKLVRRCRAGVHPEVEIGRFLAESSVRADVPRLVGWLDYVPRAGELADFGGPATVAIIHDQIDARGSAWDVMLEMATVDWTRCAALAASLGETTARLHAALAGRDDDPAFAPEAWTAHAWEAAVRRMASHADHVFDRLEQLRETLPAGVTNDVADVVAMRSRIVSGFAGSEAAPPGSGRIRVHGDYHLGQVLVGRGNDRCIVIDFEGEPGRTLEERREKTSAAKDVAGMCRSFDYLLRVLAKEGRRPYDIRDLESLESRFLAAYEVTSRALASGRPGATWWPEDRREADRLLDLYKLDKSLYELAYEIDHRPDWIDVPLAAVAAFKGLLGEF